MERVGSHARARARLRLRALGSEGLRRRGKEGKFRGKPGTVMEEPEVRGVEKAGDTIVKS